MAAALLARVGEPPMCRSDRSPFDTLETTFRLLAAGPKPLALDGRSIGLAVPSIRLWELQAILFHPATSVTQQRAALVALVGRARRRRGAWVVGLAGVLLPGLRQQAAGFQDGPPSGMACLRSTDLAGLLARLDTPGASSEGIAELLLWSVVRPPTGATRHPAAVPRLAAVPRGSR
jgi:hypothetical protein